MSLKPADLVFYCTTRGGSAFCDAVIRSASSTNHYFHVGIVSECGSVISAEQDGVVEASLEETINTHRPSLVEVMRTVADESEKLEACRFARCKIGCEYNDVFASDCRNSKGAEAYYCSQLVTEAFKYSRVVFPEHRLNFKNENGYLIEYWKDYYEARKREVPQGEDGSHPAQLRLSQDLTLVMKFIPGGIKLKSLKDRRLLECAHWVGGQSCALPSKRTFDVIEPRSGKPLTTWNYADTQSVDEVVAIAKKAQQEWAKSGWLERSSILRKTADLLKENCEDIAYWECVDNGKPLYEARADVMSCVDTFTFFSGIAHDLLGNHIPLDEQRYAYTKRVPVGVVAAIGAWNYPIQTCTWKTAPALACGNAIIYKPSPLSCVSPLILGAVLKEAGLPDGCYNVIQGDAETANYLIEHEDVTKVSFTGSIPTGKKIVKACAERNIKPVTMELGGKSALVVLEDADIDTAVACAMMANFYSQGQVCSNASKVIVHASIVDEFTRRLVEKTKALKVADPLLEDTRVGAHISADHRDKVEGYIKGAIADGASKVFGGERVDVDGLADGYYLSPCILTNVNKSMKVYHEEIFGSVLMVMPFESEEEALEIANDTKMGLAAGVVTKSLESANRVVDRLNAGNVYVNSYNDVSPLVPFGGMGESGFGRENGTAVIEHYTQIKSVFVNSGKCENPF